MVYQYLTMYKSIILALFAAFLKLYISFNSLGTTDAILFYRFARESQTKTNVEMYSECIYNHTPLVTSVLRNLYIFANEYNFNFAFLLRFPSIVADFLIFLMVFKTIPFKYQCLFALNPALIMISGYHGNIDSVMILGIVASLFFKNPLLSGLCFGFAIDIKILPILLLPCLMQKDIKWFIGAAITTIPVFLPFISYEMIRNIFGYQSYWGTWGIGFLFPKAVWLGGYMKYIIFICCIYFRKNIQMAMLALFVFLPGFGAQYMAWLQPFCRHRKIWALTVLLTSIYTFYIYTVISGFPWYRGIATSINSYWVPLGVFLWGFCLISVLRGFKVSLK